MIVVRKGKLVPPEPTMEEVLKDFGSKSVFIKGANAVDREKNVGVYVAHPSGGTIGFAYSILSARGSHLIVPVGLEKLVPSVREAAQHLGQDTLYYCMGLRVGMIPIMNAKVITEVEAFRILFGLEAIHTGGGGVSGSEGSVHLIAEGEKKALDQAIELIESIKGEAPLRTVKAMCINCYPTTPSLRTTSEDQFKGMERTQCMFQGRREEELPSYMQQRVSR
jgi:hypothetical protein